MKKKLIMFTFMAIALASVALAITFAWFYYPSRETTLESDDALEIETNLYSIDINNSTVTQQTASNSSYTLSCNYSFFQWGDEYLIEDDSPSYYALECIYNDDTYISGRFRSILDLSLKCYSGSSDGENAGLSYTNNDTSIPLRFDIAKVSYAFASCTLDLETAADVVSAVSAASFTSLELSGEDTDYTSDYYELTSSVNTLFTDASAPDFAYDSNSKIRVIYLLKVEPNTDNVNTYMNDENTSAAIIDALGSELYIYLYNVLTITDTFRSVPLKSGTISSSSE